MDTPSQSKLNDADLPRLTRPARSTGAIMLEFLGSMNLAITLLVVVAIASIIGTVLQQNVPYQDYIIKFGPFWFEVYKALGLYDVYAAGWFLLILGFLLVSTGVCVYRNSPGMLRDMRSYRENITERSLHAFHNTAAWTLPSSPGALTEVIGAHLGSFGYRLRIKPNGAATLLAAMKGGANRLGYIFTHVAIVIICIGGLLDGNLPLKFAEMTGKIRTETRLLPASEVPEISRLGTDNSSFRGLVSIPEGSVARHVDIGIRDGYLLQELPFSVELKDFRIEHYPGGQPKSFESDLVIYDRELAQPLQSTISVNHPLIYKGYSIYQANFGDGGSQLDIRAWLLANPSSPLAISGNVSKSRVLDSPAGPMTLELIDFRLYNVKPAPPDSGEKFRDIGPSFTFKMRDATGAAREYENYMASIEQDGRRFFISGVRDNPNEEFSYIKVPSDAEDSIEGFMRFKAALADPPTLRAVAAQTARDSLAANAVDNPRLQQSLASLLDRLLTKFGAGGFETVMTYLQANLPEERREDVARGYLDLLQQGLRGVYAATLTGAATTVADRQDEAGPQFFDDAVNALGVIADYGSPFYLELADFEHIQSSGLQITRAPGKNVVYFGFAMLILGVFMMFYLPQRRLWAWINEVAPGETKIVFAGGGNRDKIGFTQEFEQVRSSLEARLKALPPSVAENP